MSKTVILLPTYNERENVEYLIPEIFAHCPEVYVMVIDDNSPDGTGEAVRTLTARYPHLSLYARAKKEGLGAAYKAGMQEVLTDREVGGVMTMDADGSHAPEYLPSILAAAKTHELVIGSRYVAGGGIEAWEWWRYLLSFGGNIYARTITRLPIHDMTAGFTWINAETLRQVNFSSMQASGYAFLMELKHLLVRRLGARVAEVPILFKARRGGESKISGHIVREGLKTPWLLALKK